MTALKRIIICSLIIFYCTSAIGCAKTNVRVQNVDLNEFSKDSKNIVITDDEGTRKHYSNLALLFGILTVAVMYGIATSVEKGTDSLEHKDWKK